MGCCYIEKHALCEKEGKEGKSKQKRVPTDEKLSEKLILVRKQEPHPRKERMNGSRGLIVTSIGGTCGPKDSQLDRFMAKLVV